MQTLWDAIDRGVPRLQTIPALIKKILDTEAWRVRIHKGKRFEHETFLDFLTAKPLAGCGYDPEQIKTLIENDPETLVMWRQATVGKAGFRKRPQPLDQIRRLLPKLSAAERRQLKDML